MDTSMGGSRRDFPQTAWSLVAGLGEGTSRERALDQLCRRYWKPIYSFVRAAWRKPNEEAKDITQAFFVWLAEGEVLGRYAPEQGAFRAYLKGLLRNFVRNYEAGGRRLKRGGGAAPLRLAELDGIDDALPDPQGESPEEAFDRAWVAGLLERAVERARASCEAEGNPDRFAAFEAYERPPAGTSPTYASVADQLGLTTGQVRKHLFVVRERLRDAIRSELRDTVADAGDLDEEWRALFA